MKNSILILLLCISTSTYAQSFKSSFDTKNFPSVSFVWNEYDPVAKDKNQFILSEGGEKIHFEFEKLNTTATPKPKTILFLWEDMSHTNHNGQFDFTRQLLFNLIKDSQFDVEDNFNIGIFSRKGSNNKAIHTFLNDDFTNDLNLLANQISNYSQKNNDLSNFPSADIYRAIDEGIEILKKEPAENIRMLVVISYGVSCSKAVGGKNDTDDSRIEALKLKIPVSLVEFNPTNNSRFSSRIVEGTYGEHIITSDFEIAKKDFLAYLGEVNKRYTGQDYKITFTTTCKQDGKPHPIVLKVNGVEYSENFNAPPFSLIIWAKENPYYATGIIVFLLLMLALAIILIRKRKIRRQADWARMESEQNALKTSAEKNKQALSDYKEQEELKRQTEKETEKQEYLKNLMRNKNMFPRLQCVVNNSKFIFNISEPVTTIGRSVGNNIVLDDKTVSKLHAEIIFTGGAFEIHDRESTNKVIVNGQFVNKTTLKNSDIIGIGKALITFYI